MIPGTLEKPMTELITVGCHDVTVWTLSYLI